jgi:hypothetical protein
VNSAPYPIVANVLIIRHIAAISKRASLSLTGETLVLFRSKPAKYDGL